MIGVINVTKLYTGTLHICLESYLCGQCSATSSCWVVGLITAKPWSRKPNRSRKMLCHTQDQSHVVVLGHYLRTSCYPRPGGGRGGRDSAPLPLASDNQTGSAGRNRRPLLENRKQNCGHRSSAERTSSVQTVPVPPFRKRK